MNEHDSGLVCDTFECVCGSGGTVLVWVKLQCQLPVGLLQVFITGSLGNAQDLIEVPTILYPASSPHFRRLLVGSFFLFCFSKETRSHVDCGSGDLLLGSPNH